MTTNTSTGGELLVTRLATLPRGALINERALAREFGCSIWTIQRMVKRKELPVPVRVHGTPCWTCGSILDHMEARLAAAQKLAEREQARLAAVCS